MNIIIIAVVVIFIILPIIGALYGDYNVGPRGGEFFWTSGGNKWYVTGIGEGYGCLRFFVFSGVIFAFATWFIIWKWNWFPYICLATGLIISFFIALRIVHYMECNIDKKRVQILIALNIITFITIPSYLFGYIVHDMFSSDNAEVEKVSKYPPIYQKVQAHSYKYVPPAPTLPPDCLEWRKAHPKLAARVRPGQRCYGG